MMNIRIVAPFRGSYAFSATSAGSSARTTA